MLLLSNIIETHSRIVDNYTLHFSYYEFQTNKFIELKVFEYELLLVFKFVVNEMFINQYKPDISNIQQLYELLKEKEIEIKVCNNSIESTKYIELIWCDQILIKMKKDVLTPDETKDIQIMNLTKQGAKLNKTSEKLQDEIDYLYKIINKYLIPTRGWIDHTGCVVIDEFKDHALIDPHRVPDFDRVKWVRFPNTT